MSDITVAADAAPEPVVVPVATPDSGDRTPISASEAGRQLAQWRNKQREKSDEVPAAPQAAAADASQPSAEPADAAPPVEAPGEQTQEAEPAEVPPIEPPRSWTTEAKERWASLPRETQDYIASREQERDREVRRGQNEVAEQRKAIEAERSKAEQVRLQYEQALPALLQTMQDQQQGEFADIKTMADVEKLAREDWPRYVIWDAQQKKLAAVASEAKAAQDRQQTEFRSKWTEFATKQDQLLVEKAPELADKSKASKISDNAVRLLKDIGFVDQELAQLWNGEASVSLRDHRLQLLLLEGVRYREAKASAAKPTPKPVPSVQRPGVSKAASNGADEHVQALNERFERTGSLKDAAALRAARLRARA